MKAVAARVSLGWVPPPSLRPPLPHRAWRISHRIQGRLPRLLLLLLLLQEVVVVVASVSAGAAVVEGGEVEVCGGLPGGEWLPSGVDPGPPWGVWGVDLPVVVAPMVVLLALPLLTQQSSPLCNAPN